MLMITEGRVEAKLKVCFFNLKILKILKFQGHRVDEYIVMSGVIVNDGLWHTVKVNKDGR